MEISRFQPNTQQQRYNGRLNGLKRSLCRDICTYLNLLDIQDEPAEENHLNISFVANVMKNVRRFERFPIPR